MKINPSTPQKEARLNQFLSAFLVIAYVVCMYFISSWISTIPDYTLRLLTAAALYIVFGLLLFYATRVGEGKQIRRFSLSVLILMVLPGIYILLASLAPGMPWSTEIQSSSTLQILSYVMLGYGIPYTFVSGYERAVPETEAEQEQENTFGLPQSEEAVDEEKAEETEEPEIDNDPEEASAQVEPDEGEEDAQEEDPSPEADEQEDQKE